MDFTTACFFSTAFCLLAALGSASPVLQHQGEVCITHENSDIRRCRSIDDASAVEGEIQQELSGCVILEYYLGYIDLEFRACSEPVPCLEVDNICNPQRQATPIGGPQFIFLGSEDNFHAVQLYGTTEGYCLQGNPILPKCSDLGPCLDKLYVFAYTAGRRFAGSDTAHKIEVRAGGEVHLTELYDRKGDDYKANKGDVWIFSFSDDFNFSKCIRKPDIEGITLKPGGNDGWNVESVITFAYDADGDFHLATRDINIYRTIDGNGSPDQRSIDLTVVHVL